MNVMEGLGGNIRDEGGEGREVEMREEEEEIVEIIKEEEEILNFKLKIIKLNFTIHDLIVSCWQSPF